MDNTRDELLELIRNATNIDMICFFAIIYVVAPDSPPYTPNATRGGHIFYMGIDTQYPNP